MSELKRYLVGPGNAVEFCGGDHVLHSEAAALLAEKDAEIERLRRNVGEEILFSDMVVLVKQKDDEIASLTADNQRLRNALENLVRYLDSDFDDVDYGRGVESSDEYAAAKQALAATAQDRKDGVECRSD